MGSQGYNGLPAYYSQSSDPITPNVGFSLKGMDPIIAENFVLADAAIGTGGGSSVKVNGSVITNPNFNGTTPAAPSGHTLVTWQFDGSGNVSAYITTPSGGSPGGPNHSIQYKVNSTTFGGLASFVLNPSNGEVSITDTASSATGLAALSVFGNLQGDNLQDWYLQGSTAGTPDIWIDGAAGLNWAADATIAAGTGSQFLLVADGNNVLQISGSGTSQIVTLQNQSDTDVILNGSDGSLHLDSSGITYMGADAGILVGQTTTGGAQGSATLNASGLFVNGIAVMTNPMTTLGDLIYENSTPAPARLAIGSTGQVLTVVAGAPAWATPASSGGTVTTFSAGALSPLFTTTVANPTTTPALSFSLSNAGGGTVFGNNTTSSGAPAYTTAPVLGIPGASTGTIALASSTASGKFTITAPASAATPTLTLSTSSGVLVNVADGTVFTSTIGANGTLSLANQTANTVLAGPATGSAAAPTFRALVAADIPSGTVIWNAIGNAAGNLTLANGTNTTTFNQTTNVAWLWANTTTATSGTTNASPLLELAANYWTGAASAADTWTVGSSLVAGTNGASNLNLTHSGSSGAASLSLTTSMNISWNSDVYLSRTSAGNLQIGATANSSSGGNTTLSVPNVLCSSGVAVGITGCGFSIDPSGATFNVLKVNQYNGSAVFGFGGPTVQLQTVWPSGVTAVWSSTTTVHGTPDTGISRLGAGSIAFGNATAGDTTGSLSFGKVIKYNGVATVSGGVPAELAVSDLTAQVAAISATTVYATTATGMYRISWSAAITTASDGSSVLGGSNGFQVLYTSPTDSVVKTTVAGNSVTSSANTTGTALGGSIVVYAKTGTNIQYQYGYTSVQTTTAMAYELHIKVEAL